MAAGQEAQHGSGHGSGRPQHSNGHGSGRPHKVVAVGQEALHGSGCGLGLGVSLSFGAYWRGTAKSENQVSAGEEPFVPILQMRKEKLEGYNGVPTVTKVSLRV